MGTMVLRSHGCLQNRLHADAFRFSRPADSRRYVRRRPHAGLPPPQTKVPANRSAFPACPPWPPKMNPSRCRKNAPARASRRMVVKVAPVKELVMGEVTILRRGQGLAAAARRPLDRREENLPECRRPSDLELCFTVKLGPDPEILPKQIRLTDQKPHFYAGSGFFASPPPSSLPLPTSFFAKKDPADLATTALRCLLRLDLA